ncbi:MAG: holo-ACP synthase [bacterium]|nr:holo-ACP synthase [bacterium]
MHFGIGVDIEDVGRFSSLDLKRHRLFLQRIFTKKEIKYCFARKNYGPHLAARFCGKEAVIKALSSIGIIGVPYNMIEITNNRYDVPVVKMSQKTQKIIVKLSLSHTKDIAIAFVIVMSHNSYAR